MKYRRFGKTNLLLSVFSLGTMRCLASEAIALETVRRAISLGINHLETAQSYGKSEVFLGEALCQGVGLPRHQVYLTSKILPTASQDQMERAIDASLERLGTDYLDALAIHGLNTPDHLSWVTAADGCMAAVQRAISDGRVRHVGFSSHGALELMLAAIATDQFEFVNLHYSWFFQRNAPALALAQAKDMGVLIISPADKAGLLYTPPATLTHLCHPFSPLELNYCFLLADSRVTTLSVGPAQAAELDWPLQVADRDGHLTPAETAALERLQTHQTDQLGSDLCRQCYQCLPCPEEIHIPEVLRLRNLAIAYDMTSFGQYRYRMFENAGHWFPGNQAIRCTDCGDCLPRCPEELGIPALLRDAHQRLQGKSGRRLWQD